MGEPLMHPELAEILHIADEAGFMVNITTNGTLLGRTADTLLSSPAIRKISVSLHSYEGNIGEDVADGDDKTGHLNKYLDEVVDLCDAFTGITALRLWNDGGADVLNDAILNYLSERLGVSITRADIRDISGNNGLKLRDRLYIESAARFDWPSLGASACDVSYCHGLTQQVAVLCDGTVVPCCLDSEGTIALGNLFENRLEDIVGSPRAAALIQGFRDHHPSEELCRHCGYASRF